MKRLISLVLILTFLLSQLSFSTTAYASTETYDLKPDDWGYVYKNNPESCYSKSSFVIDSSALRVSFLKYDLSQIKSVIKSADEFSLSLMVWEDLSASEDQCFSVSLLPSDCEAWSSQELSYNSAASILDAQSTTLCITDDLVKQTYNLTFSAQSIYEHLASDTDDSVICLMIKSEGPSGCTFRSASYSDVSCRLTLTHTIDAEDVAGEVYDSLTYEVITDEDPLAVTSKLNLPLSGINGTVISWASSNEDVIDPQSGAVSRPRLGEGDAPVRLTATIQNGSVSKTKYFDFVVKSSNRPPDSMLLSTEIYPEVQTMINGASDYVNTSYTGNSLIIDKNSRMTFMKFDFSSYEDVYKTIDSIVFHFGTGGDCEPESNENITLCVLPDSMEQYVTNELTYNIARENGMTSYTSENVYTLSGLKNAQKYTTAGFLEDVEKNFAENSANKTFAIKLIQTSGNGFTMYNSSLGSYMYKPRLIVGYSIPDYQKDALLLELPSVTNTDIILPSSGVYGSHVVWESSNPALINSDGSVRVDVADEDYSLEDEWAYLTATVSEGDSSRTAGFKVRVRRKGIVDASFDSYITSDSNYHDDDEIVLNSETGNIGIIAFDFSSEYDYALASRKIVVKLYSSNKNAADRLKLIPVSDYAKKTADFTELSYADAQSYLSSGESAVCAEADSNGHYIFDVTEYIWAQNDKKAVFALVCDGVKTDIYSGANLCLEPKLVISPLAYTDEFGAEVAKNVLEFSDISSDSPDMVRKDLTLPPVGRYGSQITWTASPVDALNTDTGELNRTNADLEVTLTATVKAGSRTVTKDFIFTIVKSETDEEYAEYLLNTLTLPADILTSDITLPGESMPDGAVITWQSSDNYEAAVNGFELKLTRPNSNHLSLVLTATINYKSTSLKKEFNITVLRAQNKNLLSYKLVKEGDANAQYAVDDSVDTVWTPINPEVVYDLGSTQLISGFTFIPKGTDIDSTEIYMSADALVWEKVYTGTVLYADKVNNIIPDVTAFGRYVKFVLPKDSNVAYIGAYSVVASANDEAFEGISVPNETSSDFNLASVTASGDIIAWTSSSDVISISGTKARVSPKSSDTLVTLTAKLADGTEKTFVVLVPKAKSSSPGGGTGGGSSGGGGTSYVSSSYPATPNSQTAASPKIDSYFTDLESASWAVIYINDLYKRGIINGTGGTYFAPDNSLKREEAAKIIASALNITADSAGEEFTDVAPGEWYYPYVMAMKSSGIINGIGDGSFGTGMSISRQDAFCMIARALGISYEKANILPFNDKADISPYAFESVEMLYSLGIVNGDTGGNVNPTQMITRAEFSKLMYMVLEILEK